MARIGPTLITVLSMVGGCWGGYGVRPYYEDKTDSTCADASDDLAFGAGIQWITIEPGSFLMGSPYNEWGHQGNERLHQVALTHCYQIAATELTRAQWESLGYEAPTGEWSCNCILDDCPIDCVTPIEMTEWLDSLSEANGLTPCYSGAELPTPYHCDGFRLPTEAEWEYAARAGTQTATYNGDLTFVTAKYVLEPIAWCGIDQSSGPYPVAQKQPNAWGLFDVLGNVNEVTDWTGIYPPGPTVNPFGLSDEQQFGRRGGSWYGHYSPDQCRAASRLPGCPSGLTGFRPVRTIPGGELPDPPVISESPCPEYVTYFCAEEDPPSLEPLISASEIGEEVRFVDMAESDDNEVALLGEHALGESVEPFLLVPDLLGDGMGTISYTADGSGAETAIAVTYSPSFSEQFVMLLGGPDGSFLASSSATYLEPAVIVPIPGGEVPPGLAPRSLSALGSGIAVAGNGIAVFDGGEWSVVVAPGSGGLFNRIWHSSWYAADSLAAAVGENGRIAVHEESTWIEILSGTDSELYDVHIDFNPMTISAVGDGGVLVFGAMDDLSVCTIADEPINSVEAPTESPGYLDGLRLATGSGRLVRWDHGWQGNPICFESPVPGPVIKTRSYPCMLSNNPLHLTEAGLYGTYGCFND